MENLASIIESVERSREHLVAHVKMYSDEIKVRRKWIKEEQEKISKIDSLIAQLKTLTCN